MTTGLAIIQGITLINRDSSDMPEKDGDPCYVELATIRTKMVLSSSLSIECKGAKKKIYIVDLFVRFEAGIAPTGYLFAEAENIHENENGIASNFELVAEVGLNLPETERVKFLEYLGYGLQILIFDLPRELIFDSGETTETIPISRPKVNYLVGRPQYPSWYEHALASNATALIGDLSLNQHGQTAVIVGEFARSAAASHLLLEADDKKIEAAIELIRDLRVATRERRIPPSTKDSYSNLWDHSPYDFRQAISSLEEVERKKLADQYDRLWGNFKAHLANDVGGSSSEPV